MKRFTSMCIALTLLIVVLSISPAFSAAEKIQVTEPLQETYDNNLNKLHFYFGLENTEDKTGSALARTVSNEVSVDDDYFTYIDTETELNSAIENMNTYCEKYVDDELIQVTVEFKSDFEKTDEYIKFSKEKENIKTIEGVRSFRKRLVAFSKEYHKAQNAQNTKKLEPFNYERVYAHELSPFITMEIDKFKLETDKLLALAEDSTVANISLSLPEEFIEEAPITWNQALKAVDAYSTVNSSLYTGEHIKVGVLESSICDTTHTNLTDFVADNRLIIDSNCYDDEMLEDANDPVTTSPHATLVTSIIAKIAPEAEIYVSSTKIKAFEGLSWLIDEGCDVINCSFGYSPNRQNADGTYSVNPDLYGYRHDIDGKFDYMIKGYGVSVINSAGNAITDNTKSEYNPEAYITAPGQAYNVITVGGLNCNWGLLSCDLEYDNRSCYKTLSNAIKPEISAPIEISVPNVGTYYGTSVSAPLVTGALALFFEEFPDIATTPSVVKALLMATATETENYSNISGTYFDEKVGAGCLNYSDGLRNWEHIIYSWRRYANSVPNSNVRTQVVSLQQNDVLCAALAWSATHPIYISDCYITNYDLHLYNPDGVLVASSTLGNESNVELLRYTAPSSGNYTVAIYLNGEMHPAITSDYIGLACSIK